MELGLGLGERTVPIRRPRRLSLEQRRMRDRMERLRIICAGDDHGAIKRFVKWLEIGYSTWVGMENEANWRPISSQVEERILLKLRNYGLHDVLWLRSGMTDLVAGSQRSSASGREAVIHRRRHTCRGSTKKLANIN